MRLGVVNGLRGVAILAVVWHHLASLRPGWEDTWFLGDPIPWGAPATNGWLGVNLFFVLSGFVLYLPYAQGSRALATARDAGEFYVRRAKRLLPLYYVSGAIILAIALAKVAARIVMPSGEELVLVATITFIFTKQSYAPRLNWPLWSLAIEVWFSVLFPLLVLAAKRVGIVRVLLVVVLVALSTRVVGVAFPIFEGATPYLNPVKDSVLGRLDDFAVGMLLAELFVRQSPMLSAERAGRLVALAVLLAWAGSVLWDLHALGRLSRPTVPFYNLVIDAAAFCATAAALGSRGLYARVLRSAVLQVPGKMCFSIYVWHGVLLRAFVPLEPRAVHYVAYLGALVVVSALSYRFVEFRHVRDARSLFLADE